MIFRDEHGNQFVQMADGAKVPLLAPGITITLQTAVLNADGSTSIVGTADALAMHQTAAAYWFKKVQELETVVADLRAQLHSEGI